MNTTTAQKFYTDRSPNVALVDMFSQFPESQHRGIYAGADHSRTITDFTSDRAKHLKSLTAHMYKKADEYTTRQKAIALSDATIGFAQTNDRMPQACKDQVFLFEGARKEWDLFLQSETYNALKVLYALVLLDFCDLSEEQKTFLIKFLSFKKESQSNVLNPMEIINANSQEQNWNTKELSSLHFETTKNGLGVSIHALHSSNLKPLELPAELESLWPKNLESIRASCL